MKKILGYDYDEKTGKLVVNEQEADVVKIVFDLKVSYNLREDEILGLITKDLSLDQVINFRIFNIQNILSFDYDKKIEFGNVLEILTNNDNIEKTLIKPLLEIKETMIQENEMNSTEILIDRIDEVIKLLQNKDDILTKYNDFNETSEIINKLNIESKDATKLFSNTSYCVSTTGHEPIISKELWEQVKGKLNNNDNEIEQEEIDK